MNRILTSLLVVCLLALAPPATAAPADPELDVDPDSTVRVYDYDLGDEAFTVRDFNAMNDRGMPTKRLAPIELTGRAYVPEGAAGQRLPFVVLAHGLFWTCADDATGEITASWPCRGTLEGIRSDRGYDYLGQALAEQGMVVISVGANGVNAGELGEVADRARARVVYRHLAMWRDLVADGTGPLAGELTVAATGEPATPDLIDVADLRNVGLLGHSRGGRGVMWAAADKHRGLVPAGVRFRAVFGMASAEPPFMDRATRRLEVGRVPLMTWSGTCDPTGRNEFNRLARRVGNPVNIAIRVHGANHHHLNERWSDHSGRPGGEDDAIHPEGRPDKCFVARVQDRRLHDSLGYDDEQQVAMTYVGAFFGRYLQGSREYDAVLSGAERPVRDLTRVDVRHYRP